MSGSIVGMGRERGRSLSWGVAFCDKNMSKVLENANAARAAQTEGKFFVHAKE